MILILFKMVKSESYVTNNFGKPNGYQETFIAGQTSKIFTYNSGVNGDLGANFEITFTNGSVSGKKQSNMK